MNASESKMIESIRRRYTVQEQSPLDELRALDKRVNRPATVFAYIFGSIGALVLGAGMCLAMKVIGDMMMAGIAIGLVGIGLVSLTYPIYKRILKGRRAKYAEQVLALSDSVSQG